MKFRKFADLGWKVSEVGLGTWEIGGCWGNVSMFDAKSLLKEALDKGINFFDTSDVYGDGRSEKFLGELLKTTSDKVYVTTKSGLRLQPFVPEDYNLSNFEKFINRSLKNLGVEQIDLLQLHCPPTELCSKKETYEMMDIFVKKGKIASYGVSVFKIDEALQAIQFPNVKSIQLVFNIFRQRPSEYFLSEAKKRNIAVIARVPLASGLLTGAISSDTKFPPNDHRNFNFEGKSFDIGETFSGVNFKKGLVAVEKLRKLLPENFTLADLALKWILSYKEVTVVIPGAKNKMQVSSNVKASELNDISHLMVKINNIYENYIKKDVHNRW
tara:strand:+ start:120 stop:1100 length:981 start_codon:yes stop_codon:yes gene_type:complete